MPQSFSTQDADLIASSTARCQLEPPVVLSPYVVPQQGYAVAVRALQEKQQYNQVECTDGAFRTIRAGDVLVGALGERHALKGYSGRVPRQLEVGDTLNVLNLGGILGRCTSGLPDLGPALKVEVLGAVMTRRETGGGDGGWVHARIQDGALDPKHSLTESAPLVMVSGTAMNTGKTLAACRIVQGLTERGLDVAAAKLTGASLMRDVRKMREHGAATVATFTDAGVVCSTGEDMQPVAKGIVHHLNADSPDAIVLELGDGFVGFYGVDGLLLDQELQRFTRAHVVAAADLAGTWAADRRFTTRYRAPITAVTGPVTDNDVGRRYIETRLGIAAINARRSANRLADRVAKAVQVRLHEEGGSQPSAGAPLRHPSPQAGGPAPDAASDDGFNGMTLAG